MRGLVSVRVLSIRSGAYFARMFSPSRVAAALAALSGLAAAVAVPVANLDVTSTVGVVAGLVTILGAVATWLNGRSKWETAELWRENQRTFPDAAVAVPVANAADGDDSLHEGADGEPNWADEEEADI